MIVQIGDMNLPDGPLCSNCSKLDFKALFLSETASETPEWYYGEQQACVLHDLMRWIVHEALEHSNIELSQEDIATSTMTGCIAHNHLSLDTILTIDGRQHKIHGYGIRPLGQEGQTAQLFRIMAR